MWRVIGAWLLTIVGAIGTGVETFSWYVQPLVFYPSLIAFVVGAVILWTRDDVWLWRLR